MISLQFYNYLLVIGLLYLSTGSSLIEGNAYTPCNGSIAECDEEGEMLMESEISRRILAQKYISPGALKPDQPVCNGGGRGEAYSRSGGCLPKESNPPNRGCEKFYRCRNDHWSKLHRFCKPILRAWSFKAMFLPYILSNLSLQSTVFSNLLIAAFVPSSSFFFFFFSLVLCLHLYDSCCWQQFLNKFNNCSGIWQGIIHD